MFVGAGAADVLAIIAEGAREGWVGVEAQQQQVLEGQVGDIHIHRIAAVVGADLDTSHRQVDARHQVLLFDLARHLLGGSGFADGIQAAGVQVRELVAGRGDQPLDRFGKRAGADGSPVVVPKTHAAPDEVVGDLQVIVIGTVQVGQVDLGRVGEGQVADGVDFGQHDHGASAADLRLAEEWRRMWR